ncbi:hypothetical protein LXL04_033549 [Taraxacum kok-saghyz]
MSTYEQNQPPPVHNYPVEGGSGKDYVAAPPPMVGPPVKDGYESGAQNPPHGTQSRGDGFWRGWYCLLSPSICLRNLYISKSRKVTKGLSVASVKIESVLAEDLIDSILERVPIEDVVRTSILSRKWRYKWTTMRALVFDVIINQVLFLHNGPILKFRLHIPNISLDSFQDVDQWIGMGYLTAYPYRNRNRTGTVRTRITINQFGYRVLLLH